MSILVNSPNHPPTHPLIHSFRKLTYPVCKVHWKPIKKEVLKLGAKYMCVYLFAYSSSRCP